MKNKKNLSKQGILLGIIFFSSLTLLTAQFSPEQLKKMRGAEEFLQTARVVNTERLGGRHAVTEPFKLTLKKDSRRHFALWKNAEGLLKGHLENWQWEVAAYRMDKLLGLNMVPPTVEKYFRNDSGSCQYWVDYWINLAEKTKKDIKVPDNKVVYWNRAIYLQRAFDNLIANVDRHMRNILITRDWRMILIDHSRSFKTGKKYKEKLIYTEDHPEGNRAVEALPRSIFEKIKQLDFETLDKAMEYYLNDGEIRAVLKRRDLLVEDISRRIEERGEALVLYVPVRY